MRLRFLFSVVSFCLAFCLALLAATSAQAFPDDREVLKFAAESLGVDAAELAIAGDGQTGRIILQSGAPVAFAGSTWEVAHSAGYSGRPIDILVLIDTAAVVRGTKLISQQEPVLTLGIEPGQIDAFVAGFAGLDLKVSVQKAGEPRAGMPAAIAGATVSSGVIRSGVLRTARALAVANNLVAGGTTSRLKPGLGGLRRFEDLVKTGAVTRLTVTGAEASTALGTDSGASPDGKFAELALAVLDPNAIGASLLGEGAYSSLLGSINATDHVVLIAGDGLYSFKGTSWRKSGRFERIEIEQDAKTIALTKEMYRPVEKLDAQGVPEFRELGLFVLPQASGFDPARPFRLSLLASHDAGQDGEKHARFTLSYALPDEFVASAPVKSDEGFDPALWQENWLSRIPAIATVTAMLLSLYLILIFQDQIAARPALYQKIRIGYLATTVVVLGGIIGAQLSVVHVITFLQALRTEFSWETFLLDPIIFIIWGWVAVAMLFWGRVYCGWLCPFGALQELINKLAQRLGIRQIEIPFAVHERLWPLKYIIFLGLFGASLASITLAFRGAEVEPFKTAVTLHFMRPWPFVLYAVLLLAASLFIERFYCRYLCPLGAAIAIPARLRMFEWLKRRPQCGKECRICASQCPVQAIHPEGHINPNECIYCFNCQTLYHNEKICPPLKMRAARRSAYRAAAGGGSTQ